MKDKNNHDDGAEDITFYGDPAIASKDAPPPRWLVFSNWFFVFLGFVVLYFFWNGSHGWLDRGYWGQLQRAANTVYPYTTMRIVEARASEPQPSIQPVEQPVQETDQPL